ncbi:WecB/TagA/CpsF family glycosyltransferase [bacterium]|jgi:N-acetylglucosaminyldiphosphoundecaprenol N-acetyl-beta-D-mannosaminyltransferase|nr:WecB/TagA/CpsF family glycosyltransferase [bacterium]MBT4649253.1 WecB/TagA/CpsF family glycosyltransferase [bacterium]
MEEHKVLGVKVHSLSEQLTKELLLNFLSSDSQHQIATVNPEFIIKAQKDNKFKNILNETSLSTIDGTGIIWALQLAGHKVSLDDRITGVKLTKILLKLAESKNLKVLFCLKEGGFTTPDHFFMIIKEKYPELNFQVADTKEALIKAQIFEPVIVLNGSGAPQQEFWIAENLNRMPSVKIAVGVGGTFDFISGMKKRAPKFLRSFGLEWFWRLLKQPNRSLRIFRAVILFPILVIKNKYDKN